MSPDAKAAGHHPGHQSGLNGTMANRRSGQVIGESIVSLKDIEAVAQRNTAERARQQAAKLAAEALEQQALVDIVMPVQNEGKNITAILNSLQQHVSTPFRLLICYDHESDKTLQFAKSYQDKLDIEFVKNKGYGEFGAVMSGIEFSDAPSLICLCPDDVTKAPLVDALYRKLTEGHHHLVIASRFMPGGCMEVGSALKSSIVRTAANAMQRLGRLAVSDPTSRIRIYANRMIKEIPIESTDESFHLELLVKGTRAGYSIAEIPYRQIQLAQTKGMLKDFPSQLRWFFYAISNAFKS